MSRWIDADAFKSWIDEYVSVFKKSDKAEIKGYISHQPSIDIVRCKECKFSEVWESTAGNELYCEKQRVCPYDWGTPTAFYVKADDFCSYGERSSE